MTAHPLLVVFGAGDARSCKRYTQAAERIVAVEPREEAAKALQNALGARGSVVTAAAGDGPGEAVLTRYELPEYTSECGPAGLAILFPDIREVGSFSVDRLDAGEFLDDAFDAQTRMAAVIVDVNGAERAVLDSLSRAAAFDRVSRLEIRCGVDALYEGAMTAADAEGWLGGIGFCDVKVRGAGPLRTVSGERDLEALAAAKLSSARQEAEALRHERDAARSELDHAHERIAALEAEQREALNAVWADLDAAKTARVDAEARVEALSSQLEAAEAAGAQAVQEHHAARSELDRAHEMIEALEAEHGEALNAAWSDLDAARTARVEAEACLEALSAQLEAAEEARTRADEAAARLLHEAEGARVELGSLRSNFETVRQQAVAAEDERTLLAGDRDALRRELESCRNDLARVSEELDAEARAHGEALSAANEDRAAADRVRDEADAERRRLEAELEAQIAAGAERERAARNEAAKALAAVRDKLGLAKRSLQDSEGARAATEDRLKAAIADAQAAREEAALRQDELLRRSEAELAQAREALHVARSDLSLALHSKALAEDDLRELRNRYSQLTEVKDRQDHLLQRLSHRLGEASSVLASMPDVNIVEALTGERAPAIPKAIAKRPPVKPRVPRKKKTDKAAK